MILPNVDYRVCSLFQRIYMTESSDEVLYTFKKFYASPIPRHKEIFSCMLKHLIWDYQLFPSYPKKHFLKMARIIGGLLDHGIISDENTFLGNILRHLKSGNDKEFNFSFAVLKRFKMRLKNYPTFCYRLKKIKAFEKFPPHLVKYIEYGIHGLEPPPRRVAKNKKLSTVNCNENMMETPYEETYGQFLIPKPLGSVTTTAAADVQVIVPFETLSGI